MDGIHDLGGKHGFGTVEVEADEPVFHDRWEAAVFAISRAGSVAGAWNNSDRFRHGIERIDPVAYLSHGYYGRWLGGIENLMVEAGLITQTEISERALELGASASALIAARPSNNPDPLAPVESRQTARRTGTGVPRYAVGDAIITSTQVKPGHTRLPAYARGKRGTVVALLGSWVYPDTNAHGQGEQPQHLYTVAFDGQTLWGEDADPMVEVRLDLFEPYLRFSQQET